MDKEKLLELIRVFANGNQSEFARLVNTTQPTVSGWLRRGSFDFRIVAKGLPQVSADWLLRDEGDMYRVVGTNQVSINLTKASGQSVVTNGNVEHSHITAGFEPYELVVAREEIEALRAENKALRERCDKLTDKLLEL